MRSIEVISLSRRDTIDNVCQALEQADPEAQVWVVAPWGAAMTGRLLNLRRLFRAADRVGLDLHLVSGHTQTRLLAREAGLASHVTLPLALRKYRRRLRDSAVAHRRRDMIETATRTRQRRRRRGLSWGGALAALVSIALLAAALGGAALALVPSAEVVIQPVSRPVATAFRVTADPMAHQVDFGKAVIPSRRVQVIVEAHGEEPATGGLDVADGYASGEVLFANRTDRVVVVPKGTIVRTGSGTNVRFVTLSDVEVPGQIYAHARVGIVALDPGHSGNVQALTINTIEGDMGYTVSAINPSPTQGGTVRRMPVVTQDDFVRLEAKLLEQLQRESHDQLVTELEKGEFIPSQSLDLRIMAKVYDQTIGQRNQVASMTLKVVVRGLAIDGGAIDDLALQLLERDSQDQAMRVINDSLRVTRSEQISWNEEKAQFEVQARGMVASAVSAEAVQRGLLGKEVNKATAWLEENYALAAPPQIDLMPIWWDRLPWLPGRLKVRISAGNT